MLDMLKEHGRDYDNSKAEIVDFFLTAFCGSSRRTINCPYSIGERIEYLSFRRKRWIPGKVLELRGANEHNHYTPTDMIIELEIKNDSGHWQTRLISHIDKWEEVMKLRKPRK
jgi:hypothetical protein